MNGEDDQATCWHRISAIASIFRVCFQWRAGDPLRVSSTLPDHPHRSFNIQGLLSVARWRSPKHVPNIPRNRQTKAPQRQFRPESHACAARIRQHNQPPSSVRLPLASTLVLPFPCCPPSRSSIRASIAALHAHCSRIRTRTRGSPHARWCSAPI
jgi:hypothetical protein